MTSYYSDSIKTKAIKNVIENKTPVKKVAAKYNIPLSTLYNWISVYKKDKNPPQKSEVDKSYIQKVNQLTTENNILKKALHVENTTESKFQFIYANKEEFPIQTMCKVLEVSSSGYYKFVNSYTSEQELHHQHITELVREAYVKHEGKIGSPKITELINQNEVITSQATVARILKRNKDQWRKTYTQFHDNHDVQLHFHNKDTVYDIKSNKHYHKRLAYEDIVNWFESVQFSDIKNTVSLV